MTNLGALAPNRFKRMLEHRLTRLAAVDMAPEPSQNPNLCRRCAKLHLTAKDFIPKVTRATNLPRRWDRVLASMSFADVLSQKACPLCRLVAHAVRVACHARQLDTTDMQCKILMTYFSVYWDNKYGNESFRFLTVRAVGSGPERH